MFATSTSPYELIAAGMFSFFLIPLALLMCWMLIRRWL